MKVLTNEFEAALRKRSITYAFLAEIEAASETLRVWSGAGTLDWDGKQWRGVGRMGRITGIGETAEVRVSETSYELIAPEIDPATEIFINEQARGGKARTWLALLDQNERVIPDPVMLDESTINYAAVDVSEDMEAVIRLVGNSAVFDFRKPTNVAITNEQQQADFPGDTGFDRIPTEVSDKQVSWTLT